MNPNDLDLDLHIRDVGRLLEYEDLRQVILVGHAYSGMVITGVAEECPERLAHLVYVNGIVLLDGEAMVDLLASMRGEEHASWAKGISNMAMASCPHRGLERRYKCAGGLPIPANWTGCLSALSHIHR